MAAGHCDFCGIWHSGGCGHPARYKYDSLVEENARLRQEAVMSGNRSWVGITKDPIMKRLIETSGDGLEAFLGEKVTLFGLVYIYTGTLAGVNDHEVELTDASIVYETGQLDAGEWKDAQRLPSPWHVRNCAVESWGPAKC